MSASNLNLFGDVQTAEPDPSPPEARPSPVEGPFARVALEQGIDRTLDYAVPARIVPSLKVGQRVRVPLGKRNRPAFGYVVSISPTTDFTASKQIKSLLAIADERVLVPPKLMELSRWMSRYYVTPIGMVLDSVIPSAVKKKIGIGYNQMVRLIPTREQVQETFEQTRALKRRAILARLLQMEPGESIELVRLAGEAGVTTPTVRKLTRLGLLTITPEVDLPSLSVSPQANDSAGSESDIELNADQKKAYDELLPRLAPGAGGFSVNLLYGVTGSGKTEVYIQCIREVVRTGKRAIVLVPEIALTPQTVRRFTNRFAGVAVLHSGLSATQRHRYWQMIAMGHAQVVVGARSAVFAPLPDLGIIVVDEEHDASYKQDSAPRYHGRDVAIKRAQLENVPVLLGSATPSLETYWKVGGVRGAQGEGFGREGTGASSPGTVLDRRIGYLVLRLSPSPRWINT